MKITKAIAALVMGLMLTLSLTIGVSAKTQDDNMTKESTRQDNQMRGNHRHRHHRHHRHYRHHRHHSKNR